MQGFFTKKEITSKSRPDGKIYSCISCGLYKNAKTPRMSFTGNGKKRILNISATLDKYEDQKGKHWLNLQGRNLKAKYASLGIDLHEDCWNVSAVACFNGKTKVTPYHMSCCRNILLNTIKKLKPHIIVCFGERALKTLIGHKINKFSADMDIWRGWTIPDRDLKAFLCPVFSPKYVVEEDLKEVHTIWEQDLVRAVGMLKKPFPAIEDDTSKIQIVDDLRVLESIKDGSYAVNDIETTGLKPHRKGHKIVSVSICDGNNTYAFLTLDKTRRELKPFTDILKNPKIGKIAQNMKYEDTWYKVRWKIDVKNWGFDTLIASHILDNRKGITGLKFQVYVRFGVSDYDSTVSPYLESGSKNNNDFNRVLELVKINPYDLLLYGGLDSYYTDKLAQLQMKEMGI